MMERGEYEEDDREESLLSIKEEELNTTSSTARTSSSNLKRQRLTSSKVATTAPTGAGCVNGGPVYDFTMQALEMSLYGYMRQTDPMFASHAISGLRGVPPFRMIDHQGPRQISSIGQAEFKKG